MSAWLMFDALLDCVFYWELRENQVINFQYSIEFSKGRKNNTIFYFADR